MAKRTRQIWDSETERTVRSLDALAEYDEFCQAILPQLRRMVLENWPPERIRKTFGSYIQAQAITKALQGNLRAIQDTLDRLEGKPMRRKEVSQQYTKMSKAELAALAFQKLVDAGLIPRHPAQSATHSESASVVDLPRMKSA